MVGYCPNVELKEWCPSGDQEPREVLEPNTKSVYTIKENLILNSNTTSDMKSLTPEPPFEEKYGDLFRNGNVELDGEFERMDVVVGSTVEELEELPVIDLGRLNRGGSEDEEECKREIALASQEWGFFQVVNHGISREILQRMKTEQVKLFSRPFVEKANDACMNFPAGSYRWGSPSPTSLSQLSWSEAFHVPLSNISPLTAGDNLSLTMEQFATKISDLAQKLGEILAEKLGQDPVFFKEHCLPNTCYLRLNRYPPCTVSSKIVGLMPHTDSDFLTILHQDNIGGLQLVKDGRWVAVKPNDDALIINIGDLLQAWSNDVYKSVEHRVLTNRHKERFSMAYFFCPSYDSVIQSCGEPQVYRRFSFREFRQQVQDDVKRMGYKIGLPRFIL